MEPVIILSMLPLKSAIKGALIALLAVVLLLAGIWVWMGVRIGIWTYPQYDRHFWLEKELPIAREFWGRKIRAGDDAEALIRQRPPHQMERFGPWVRMDWFPGGPFTNAVISFIGIGAIAKNGILVFAAAYSDDGLNNRTFFNTITTNDEADYGAAFDEYVNERTAKIQKNPQMTNGTSK